MAALNLGRPGLSVLPLGVGDAFSAIHHPTCMLVSRYQTPAWDNDFILIDCPQSIRKMMREADDGRFHGLDLHRVNTLVLTHLHADHAGGLETIAAFFKIVLGRKLRLVALPEVLEGVPRFLETLSSIGTMEDFFDVRPIDPTPGVSMRLKIGDNDRIVIEGKRTNHPIPTAGLRIGYLDKQFSYSCDTTFDPELWEWLWHDDPDLVVHEVGHGIHTSYDDLVKAVGFVCESDEPDESTRRQQTIQAMLKATSMRLIHYPDDMLPMLETSSFRLMREGKLEVV